MAKRQGQLPGTEGQTVKEVDDAAEQYVDARDRRMMLTKEEKAAKNALLGAMERNGLTVYKIDLVPPLVVTVRAGEADVTVRQIKAEPDDGDLESGDDIDFDGAVRDEASAAAAEVERLTTKKAKSAAKPKKPKAKKGKG